MLIATSGLARPCTASGHLLGGREAILIQVLGLRKTDSLGSGWQGREEGSGMLGGRGTKQASMAMLLRALH